MNDDEDRFRGYISKQHTVWCGDCGQWIQIDEPVLATFKKLVLKLGWRNPRGHGWCCPECYKKQPNLGS